MASEPPKNEEFSFLIIALLWISMALSRTLETDPAGAKTAAVAGTRVFFPLPLSCRDVQWNHSYEALRRVSGRLPKMSQVRLVESSSVQQEF